MHLVVGAGKDAPALAAWPRGEMMSPMAREYVHSTPPMQPQMSPMQATPGGSGRKSWVAWGWGVMWRAFWGFWMVARGF